MTSRKPNTRGLDVAFERMLGDMVREAEQPPVSSSKADLSLEEAIAEYNDATIVFHEARVLPTGLLGELKASGYMVENSHGWTYRPAAPWWREALLVSRAGL